MTRNWTFSGLGGLIAPDLIGDSSAMKRLREQIARCASCDAPVLIMAPRGTGKSLVARAIHDAGPRRSQPFMKVDCAGLTPTLFESTLFGHEAGAFTGANQARAGLLELAGHGTVFLDEIGEIPLELQPKLLCPLEEGRVRRVGASRETVVNARIIAATNRPLEAAAASGAFRADLFDRLDVVRIEIPTLAARREDIPLLAAHFAAQLRPARRFTPAALDRLTDLPWPANVRGLRSKVVSLCANCDEDPIGAAAIDEILWPMSCPPPTATHIEARGCAGRGASVDRGAARSRVDARADRAADVRRCFRAGPSQQDPGRAPAGHR